MIKSIQIWIREDEIEQFYSEGLVSKYFHQPIQPHPRTPKSQQLIQVSVDYDAFIRLRDHFDEIEENSKNMISC